jgi:hypothetical protein
VLVKSKTTRDTFDLLVVYEVCYKIWPVLMFLTLAYVPAILARSITGWEVLNYRVSHELDYRSLHVTAFTGYGFPVKLNFLTVPHLRRFMFL